MPDRKGKECEICGQILYGGNPAMHLKSKKHQAALASMEAPQEKPQEKPQPEQKPVQVVKLKPQVIKYEQTKQEPQKEEWSGYLYDGD
ncbi:MAG TPA: hypothetical protein VLM43_16580 [Desulfobacterales bacterium]|nr:hypothetical protein [Desulfobacterales bacterium]